MVVLSGLLSVVSRWLLCFCCGVLGGCYMIVREGPEWLQGDFYVVVFQWLLCECQGVLFVCWMVAGMLWVVMLFLGCYFWLLGACLLVCCWWFYVVARCDC